MSFSDILFHNVFPFCGGVTSVLLGAAPYKSVQQVLLTNYLGSVNTFPIVMTILNAYMWMMYGLYKQDYYIWSPNVIGYAFGLYFMFSLFHFENKRNQIKNLLLIVGGTGLINIVSAISFISYYTDDKKTGENVLGMTGVFILLVFYSSPLSSLAEVIKLKNAKSINPAITFAALMNSLLWTTYGLAIGDFYVYGPNGLGAFFAFVQLGLIILFGRREEGQRIEDPVSAGNTPIQSNEVDPLFS